jgi:glycosyltransferase involved in cell wall biosynthesis
MIHSKPSRDESLRGRAHGVAVIIPTRNRRLLVKRAIGCALGQLSVRVSIIVVDDGSTDGTAEMLAACGDDRLTVVRNPVQRGVTVVRNQGLAQATEPWVAFLDDDDVWAPTKLAEQVAAATRARCGWCCTGDVALDHLLRVTHENRPPDPATMPRSILAHNVVPGGASGVLARTDLVRSVGGFDPALRILADWDLWIRLGLASRSCSVDRPLVGYVQHGGNMSYDAHRVADEIEYVGRKHAPALLNHGIQVDDVRWLEWIADMHRRAGRRTAPMRIWAGLAWRLRRPRLLIRAASTFAWPGWVHVRDAQHRRRMTPSWRSEAEAWLKPLQEPDDASSVR